MGGVAKSDIDLVKKSVKISEYIEKYVVKEIPWYFNDYTVDLDLKPYIKCPIHGEDTPSLKYYEDTNTFYCFGCGAGGDVINFHRLFVKSLTNEEISVSDAVDFLKNRFLEGKQKEVAKILPKSEVDNQAKDVLRLSRLCTEIEETLKVDKSLPEEKKKVIYDCVDTVLALIELRKVKAVECIDYVKSVYGAVVSS